MKQYLIRTAREGVFVKGYLLNGFLLPLVTINGTEHCVVVVAHAMVCLCCPQQVELRVGLAVEAQARHLPLGGGSEAQPAATPRVHTSRR